MYKEPPNSGKVSVYIAPSVKHFLPKTSMFLSSGAEGFMWWH